ncbi:transformer-2 protein homolog beta-like isoform X2 [Biomphalaria glabrata]|uniref:Transformer-2 protein homolog beta-like isoform X2 n=1 Tax=Biomphalaria glabrata TaxID=6526 RepID=A0A2C9M2S6_BIOGL|nr:transformer-2 protein homolog beta-like isoform X2 [Biomphalaria glabrata]
MASDKETSPDRSRQADDRRKRRKSSPQDESPHHKSKRRSSSSSRRSPLSSRSPSPSERHRGRRGEKSSRTRDDRSRSRTPTAYRKDGDRDDPNVCHCLGVFGLSSYTQEKDLKEVFGRYGPLEDICIIYDRQSGHSKGYGFVYFKSTSDAVEARKGTQGLVLDRRPIRVDYSFTTRPHSPTPGRYMGRRTSKDLDKYYCHDSGDYDDRSYRDSGRRSYRDKQHYCDYDSRDDYRDDYDDSYSRRSKRYSPYSHR